jgi:hypothetical protein
MHRLRLSARSLVLPDLPGEEYRCCLMPMYISVSSKQLHKQGGKVTTSYDKEKKEPVQRGKPQ